MVNPLFEFSKPVLVKGIDSISLQADLILPRKPLGVVLIIHGSGSSRLSPRNRLVARTLRERGLGTLLLDTETQEERDHSIESREASITVREMAERIQLATEWLSKDKHAAGLPIGYLGAGSGAAAAFVAAAKRQDLVKAVVSRGGRLEMAFGSLSRIHVPALLIVGARDTGVVHFNRDALDELGSSVKGLEIIPGARHLFEEPGTLAAVAMHASNWFSRYLPTVSEALPQYAIVQKGA